MNWYKMSSDTGGVRVWLDDERNPQSPIIQRDYGALGDELWVKAVDETKRLLESGNVIYISFDHDLGLGSNGHDLAKWVEEKAFNGELGRFQWRVHSANPVGRENIKNTMMSAERFWDRNKENNDV